MGHRSTGRRRAQYHGRAALAVAATATVLLAGCAHRRGATATFTQQATQARRTAPDSRPWFCNAVGNGTPPGGHGNGSHVAPMYEGRTKGPLSWSDCAKLAGQLDRLVATTRGLETRAKAEAAGWRPVAGDYIPGLGTHHGKFGGLGALPGGMTPGSIPGVDVQAITTCLTDKGFDTMGGGLPNFNDPAFLDALRACGAPVPAGGIQLPAGGPIPGLGSTTFDPAKPQFLIYGGPTGDAPLVGAAYTFMGKGDPPEAFAGGNDWWHAHNKICMGSGGILAGAEEIPDEQCTALGGRNIQITGQGGVFGDNSNYVLHVWLPPYEYRPDLFVSGQPCLLADGVAPQDDPCWEIAHRDPSLGPPATTPGGAHDDGHEH